MEPRAGDTIPNAAPRSGGQISRRAGCGGCTRVSAQAPRPRYLRCVRAVEADGRDLVLLILFLRSPTLSPERRRKDGARKICFFLGVRFAMEQVSAYLPVPTGQVSRSRLPPRTTGSAVSHPFARMKAKG